ncbi:hypothetical protein ACG2LH_13620 [Zhouia sp. PK063]|uniref:hypothetical protein n=1 Tax=Zhouia sp. PK063 TaxID=3373602 RepID=UPI0037A197C5
MSVLGVVITDGVGYRNFVLSDFLQEALQLHDKVVLFSCLPLSAYDIKHKNLELVFITEYKEHFYTWFFRKMKEVAHLKLFEKDNFGFRDALRINYSTVHSNRGKATRLIYKVTSLFKGENFIHFCTYAQQQTFRKSAVKNYSQLLQQHGITHLFFTHQRPPYIAPVITAANKNNIPTSTFIFSWDNLASKGRMAGDFKHYLVWSEKMKEDLLHYYSRIKEHQIAVVGTPQFEPYVLDRYVERKALFYKKTGLDDSLKTLCFSCGDSATSKNDELYIATIAEAILNKTITAPINFLVRTSPAEDGSRFLSIQEKYPFIIWNFPKWNTLKSDHQESWSQRIPTIEDVKDLRSILSYSDVNINMLSTMSLDFMLFNKPVINVVFGNATNGLYDDQRFLNYAHIKDLTRSKAAYLALDKETLLQQINNVLTDTSKNLFSIHPDICEDTRTDGLNSLKPRHHKEKEQEQLLQFEIGKPLAQTGKRIAETLLQWS